MSLRTKLGIDLDVNSSGVGKGISSTESKFSRLSGIGKKAGLALAGGLGLAAAAGVKLAQSAAEDQLAATKLKTTIQNVTGATNKQVSSVEDWITAQGKALGVADDDLRPALGRLVAATGSVAKAQKLAALGMNISAGTGKSLETVTTALAKAQNGSLGGLSRLGVATKDAAGNTLTLDQVTGKLAKTYDGAASAAADTAAGRFGRLKLQLGELGEDIGSKFLPAATSALGWVNEMLPKGEALAGTIGEKVGPAFRAVAGFITERVIPAGRELFSWYMEKIAPGLKRTVTPVLEGLKSVFNKVRDAVYDNRESLGKLLNAAKTIAEFIVNKVAPVFGTLLGGALKVLAAAIGGVVRGIGWLVGKLDGAWKAARRLIQAFKDLAQYAPFNHGGGDMSDPPVNPGGTLPSPGGGVPTLPGGPARGAVFVSGPRAVELRVVIEGNLIDPAGAAQAIERVLFDSSVRKGLTLALGARV